MNSRICQHCGVDTNNENHACDCPFVTGMWQEKIDVLLEALTYAFKGMPEVVYRRPSEYIDGYMERDLDFMENNKDACIWFLENRDFIFNNVNRAINRARGE